jgi:chromosome segregation ATPase
MLTEFTSKNAQLELEVNTLRKELESCKSSHDMELSDRMKQIESLNSDITASLLREEESSYEIERLRTELAALSSTYSNLESEYNRTQSISSAAAREVPPAGEQACEADLSSHGRAGSEIEALRAENARLKQDARAADEVRTVHGRLLLPSDESLTPSY